MAKIVINSQYCKGCELCIDVCSQCILKKGTEITAYGTVMPVQTEQEKCTGCRLCAIMCPDAAIDVYK